MELYGIAGLHKLTMAHFTELYPIGLHIFGMCYVYYCLYETCDPTSVFYFIFADKNASKDVSVHE